jgi:hypothetical protein
MKTITTLLLALLLATPVFAEEFALDDASVFEVTEYIHPEETYTEDYWTNDYTVDFTPEDWVSAYEEYAHLAEQVLNDFVGDRSLLTWDSYDELDGIMVELLENQ